ncbi:DUF3068 domain-containing protein [Spirillospora sp. NPDC047279]|uniref:DUF3068 domain-containing protein n=1 Tax=Spirillospora sp. NPDC047279 TaxID=3155478 RepID=UPI0034066C82
MRFLNKTTAGTALFVLGCFSLALAPMMRFYLADRLMVVPDDRYARSTLVGSGAKYLDVGKMKVVENANVVATSTLRGAPGPSTSTVAIWDTFSVVEDATTGADLDLREWRMAIDRKSSQLRNCCGAAINRNTSVKQSGLGLIWPIGNVERRSYPLFDPATGRTWPARFEGTRKVEGITAYTFVQRIDPTPVGQVRQLPGTLLGLPAGKAYDVDRVYRATVTTWVDPRTGAPVDRQQQAVSTLRTKDGVDRLTIADITLRMDDRTRREAAATSDDSAGDIALIRTTGPLIALAVGVVALVAAVLLSVRPGRRRGQHHQQGSSDAPAPAVPGK